MIRASSVTPSKAGIAQLVEHDLAKVGVASSSLVSRSKLTATGHEQRSIPPGQRWPVRKLPVHQVNLEQYRLGGRVVMQRTATPRTPVRFRPAPPLFS